MIFLSLKYNIDIILNKLAIIVVAVCILYWAIFFYIEVFSLFFENLILSSSFFVSIFKYLPFKSFTFFFNDLFYSSFNWTFDSIFISGKETKFLAALSQKWASFNHILRQNAQPCAGFGFNQYDGFTQFKRLSYKGGITGPLYPDLRTYFSPRRVYPFIFDPRYLENPKRQVDMFPSKYSETLHKFKVSKFYKPLDFHFSIASHALNPIIDKTTYIIGANPDYNIVPYGDNIAVDRTDLFPNEKYKFKLDRTASYGQHRSYSIWPCNARFKPFTFYDERFIKGIYSWYVRDENKRFSIRESKQLHNLKVFIECFRHKYAAQKVGQQRHNLERFNEFPGWLLSRSHYLKMPGLTNNTVGILKPKVDWTYGKNFFYNTFINYGLNLNSKTWISGLSALDKKNVVHQGRSVNPYIMEDSTFSFIKMRGVQKLYFRGDLKQYTSHYFYNPELVDYKLRCFFPFFKYSEIGVDRHSHAYKAFFKGLMPESPHKNRLKWHFMSMFSEPRARRIDIKFKSNWRWFFSKRCLGSFSGDLTNLTSNGFISNEGSLHFLNKNDNFKRIGAFFDTFLVREEFNRERLVPNRVHFRVLPYDKSLAKKFNYPIPAEKHRNFLRSGYFRVFINKMFILKTHVFFYKIDFFSNLTLLFIFIIALTHHISYQIYGIILDYLDTCAASMFRAMGVWVFLFFSLFSFFLI